MITASIQFKTKKDLNTFLQEMKKSIRSPWGFEKCSNNDSKKSFLKHELLALSFCFVDTGINTILLSHMLIGVFSNYIKILSVTVFNQGLDKSNEKLSDVNVDNHYYNYIVGAFIDEIKMFNSYNLIINKDLLIKLDLHQQVEDIRMSRPIFFKEQITERVISLNRIEINKVENKTYEFVPPNNIALLLSISKKELEVAKDIFHIKFRAYFGNKTKLQFKDDKLSKLYDYFEHIQTSLIFCYTAIEALCNIAIPDDYVYTFVNNKGAKEEWNKCLIERYSKTSEKLKEHLPKILNVKSPCEESFWPKFIELEKIRNNLIHQKIGDGELANSAYQEDFLKDSIFDIIYSGFLLIEFFCNANTKHSFFPMGISNSDIEIKIVDNFSKHFQMYDPQQINKP